MKIGKTSRVSLFVIVTENCGRTELSGKGSENAWDGMAMMLATTAMAARTDLIERLFFIMMNTRFKESVYCCDRPEYHHWNHLRSKLLCNCKKES